MEKQDIVLSSSSAEWLCCHVWHVIVTKTNPHVAHSPSQYRHKSRAMVLSHLGTQAVYDFRTWSCQVTATFFHLITTISMFLIQAQGFKSTYKGSCTELPTTASDGLFVPNCIANLSLFKKWLIFRLLKRAWCQLKLYCNRALLLWPGWGLTSASLSSGPHWSARASAGGDLVCLNTHGEKGAHRGKLKCPLGVSVSPSVADTTARVGDAAQPIHQLDVAAAAEEQHLASTIPCLQWPSPDSSSCIGSGTGLTPWRTSSAHKNSSKWVFFSPLCSFEAIRMSWHERSDGSRMRQRWELVHSFCFTELLSWFKPYQKPSPLRLVKLTSLPTG